VGRVAARRPLDLQFANLPPQLLPPTFLARPGPKLRPRSTRPNQHPIPSPMFLVSPPKTARASWARSRQTNSWLPRFRVVCQP